MDAQDQRLKAGYSLRDNVSSDVIDVSVAQQPDTQLTTAEPSAAEAFAEVLASAINRVSVGPTPDEHLSPVSSQTTAGDRGQRLVRADAGGCSGAWPIQLIAASMGTCDASSRFLLERTGSRGMFRVSVDRDQ